MNRILLLAVAGCGLLAGTASAQYSDPLAPPPMGMTAVPQAYAPTPGQVTGGCADCGGATVGYARHDSRFGWNPIFRKLAFWKRDNSCGTTGGGLLSRLRGRIGGIGRGLAGAGAAGCGDCGFGQGGFGQGGFGQGLRDRFGNSGPAFDPYPNGTPGTLVFPNHHYTRSPRDFFMMDSR